jgi:hypothetical protein
MRKYKPILLAIVAVLILWIFIPFPMVVARNCEIQVVDMGGKPWPDAKVSRGWSYGSSETLEEKHTGQDGLAGFDRRVGWHSLFGRLRARVVNVVLVHGDAHISDAYLVSFPAGFTADIDGETWFKWVYEPGHFAKIDLSSLPRHGHYHFKFTVRKQTP